MLLVDSGVAVEDMGSLSGAHLLESNTVATDKVRITILLFMRGWIMTFLLATLLNVATSNTFLF